jgi:hypothetical protein
MKRRNPLAIGVIAVSLLAPSAVFASSIDIHSPVNAMFGKNAKNVHFTLVNDSTYAMNLKVGGNALKLDAGKSARVDLPVGAQVVADNATPLHPAGSLIAQVTNSLNGAIIHVK